MKQLDERDTAIREARVAAREGFEGPRVGDFIILEDQRLMRFSHDHGEGYGIQVSESGSFYMGHNGGLSFSGALEPAIPYAHIQESSRIREGSCWFFSHDLAMKDNGVDTVIPCRVFVEVRA
jgi:hypothetical protein